MSEILKKIREKYKLNAREVLILAEIKKGVSLEQISENMKLSIRTVSFYVIELMVKLKCKSIEELKHVKI